jgi:uncharacterized CHY-type Zn-finger protein
VTVDKYTKSARGKTCTVRLYGICNHNPDTTVFAHLNGGGLAMKRLNIHGAYACSDCHDALDRRTNPELERDFLNLAFLEAVIRTQEIMVKDGVLKL